MNNKKLCLVTAASFGVLLSVSTANAQSESKAQWWRLGSGEVRLTTGVDYSSGDYGEAQDTDILYIPVAVRYANDPWTLRLTVPYIRIEGPGSVVGGGDAGIVIGGGGAQRTTESGIGDVVASATYTLPDLASQGTFVDLTGKVKFGTADEEKRLGTGENDYYLQIDLARTYGQMTPLATLGYRFVGEPAGSTLDDVVYFSVGGSYKFSPKTSAGLLYDFREAASPSSDDSSEIFGYVNYKLNPNWSWTVYGATGFTDGSPDLNVGVQVGYTP